MYIKYDKDGKFENILKDKPKWFFDDGSQVTDEWLIENENIYPVIDKEPSEREIWGIEKKEPSEWVKHDKHVEVTYWIIKDEPTEYDFFSQYLELKDRKDWKVIDSHLFRTYDVKEYDIKDIKNELIEYVKDIRLRVIPEGILYNIDGDDIKFKINSEIRTLFLQYYLFLDERGIVDWELEDGSFIKLTKQQIRDIMNNITLHIKQCFANEKILIDLIEKADNILNIKNIYDNEINKGWGDRSVLFGDDVGGIS